jgi:hypothetical protein
MGLHYYILLSISFALLIFGLKDPKYFASCIFLSLLNIPNIYPYYPTLYFSFISFSLLLIFNRNLLCQKFFFRTTFMIFFFILLLNFLAYIRNLPIENLHITIGKLLESFFITGTAVVLINSRGFIKISQPICIVFLVSIVLGIIQLFSLSYFFQFDYPFDARFSFLAIQDPNYSGMYLIFFLSLLSTKARFYGMGYIMIASFILCLIAIILSLSRTTVIASSLVIIIHIYSRYNNNINLNFYINLKKYFVTFCISSFFIIIWIMLFQKVFQPLLNQFINQAIDNNVSRLSGEIDTVSSRINIWSAVLGSLNSMDILFGIGDTNIPNWNHVKTGYHMTFHSLPLTLLVKYGLIAPCIYLLFISRIVYTCFRPICELRHFLLTLSLSYFIFTLMISDEIGIFILILIGFMGIYKGRRKIRLKYYKREV